MSAGKKDECRQESSMLYALPTTVEVMTLFSKEFNI